MYINLVEIPDIIIRSIISLVTLFFITRIMGKKQASELSLFDYVIGISIGNFGAEYIMNIDLPVFNGILATTIFGLAAYFVSYITMKNITLRRMIIGSPTVIIQNGNISMEGLIKEKIDVNDFLQQCRTQGYFDISEIEYAILEVNGQLSILPKSDYKPLTPKDMSIKTDSEDISANIIIDGQLMISNIENTDKDLKWVKKELKKKGYEKYDDIILATYKSNELTIHTKNSIKNTKNVLE